jgi:uracil-DNA glycosylase family 4
VSPEERPTDDSEAGMSAESNESELRAIVGSARELLVEWVEEGIDQFEKLAVAPPSQRPEQNADATVAAKPSAPEVRPTAPPPAAPAPASSDHLTLAQVREQLGECTRCELCKGRKNIVFGSGNPDADLLFIGEGPGQQEDEQGLPFVGRAGELLTNMIEKGLQISRSEVYICNIVKCRPPDNRNPLPPEVAACQPFLDGQIDAVAPKVIVTLGKPAASLLLGRDVAITRTRGTWQSYRGIPLMPTLHPAFVLRQYTPENRRLVWEDLKAALTRAREGA